MGLLKLGRTLADMRCTGSSGNALSGEEPVSLDKYMSRRELMTHAGAGMVGAALVTSVPGAQAQMDGNSTAAAFIDPTSKYPKPPYPSQSQPWPGLASKMNPRPDHGETSYKGSGRLRGRKALITGGDSGMGRAAAIVYAREGADVASSYYPTEEPDAREVIQLIQAEGCKGIPIPGVFENQVTANSSLRRRLQNSVASTLLFPTLAVSSNARTSFSSRMKPSTLR